LIENSKRTTQEQCRDSIVDDAKQSKVFMAFRLHYGALWTDRLPENKRMNEAFKRLWQYSLKLLSMERVQLGINKIILGETEFSKFPPNPAEFVEICNIKAPKVPEFKALPRPSVNKAAAREELSKCWKLLGLRNR